MILALARISVAVLAATEIAVAGQVLMRFVAIRQTGIGPVVDGLIVGGDRTWGQGL